MKIAKLLVPAGGWGALRAGGLDQLSAGETFTPTQFGLVLLLPANFVANRSPSLKLGEVSVNAPCALAGETLQCARATAPARMEPRRNMTSSFCLPLIARLCEARFWRAECSFR